MFFIFGQAHTNSAQQTTKVPMARKEKALAEIILENYVGLEA
jgi:hypothetical protein